MRKLLLYQIQIYEINNLIKIKKSILFIKFDLSDTYE